MIKTSDAYKSAVVAETRRIRVRVPIRIQDPDLQYGDVTATSSAPVSRPEQIYDDEMEPSDSYASLEDGRWVLDGTMDILEDDYSYSGQVGYVSGEISGEDGTFATPQTVTLGISGVDTLQSCIVFFPGGELDGVAEDFTVSIIQGGTAYHTESFSGNTAEKIIVSGFTVYNPDAIAVTVTKWSIPHRRMRVMEIYPGYAETWTEGDLSVLSIKMQASINAMATPYGTASITMDNTDRLFDPRNKSGLFASLEERQPVPIQFGAVLQDGSEEWIPAGIYYQHNGAWQTSDDGLTMRWDLVDIVGLLADRTFIAQETLPTTLDGWASALVDQLGSAFAGHYTVDPEYSAKAVTADAEAVSGQNCGNILRWLCQATGTFARADAETGYLALEPLWSQGNEYTMDNLQRMPTISANDNLASIIFKLDTDFVVSGNTSNSANTVTVDNPFLADQTAALEAARHILVAYGGNKISTTGRGDPSSEVGDVVTLQLDRSNATTARILSQTFDFTDGVLSSCKTELLQADGAFLYTDRVVLTEDGTWTAPAGITELDVVLVGGGQAGGHGAYGTYGWPTNLKQSQGVWGSSGARGTDGTGALVWHGKIQINDSQTFAVSIGAGGIAGDGDPVDGGDTTFGAYSSANGKRYNPAWTDIASGNAYARSGIRVPADHTGDGGRGGAGGSAGYEYWEAATDEFGNPLGHLVLVPEKTIPAGAGKPGTNGASGCVIIYWDKGEIA